MLRDLFVVRTILFTAAILVISSGCHVAIDSVEKWCEHVYWEVDLTDKYVPWAPFPIVSFDYESVRDNYVALMDSLWLDIVDHRAERMAWRDGMELHVESLATLMAVAADTVIDGWKQGLERARLGTVADSVEECLFGTAASLFDRVHIHTGIWDDPRLRLLQDSVTTLETQRTQTF